MAMKNSIALDHLPLFRPTEAALAIIGEAKTDDPVTLLRATPELERLRDDYETTRRWYASAPDDGQKANCTATPRRLASPRRWRISDRSVSPKA